MSLMNKHVLYLALGSNLGNSAQNIKTAYDKIEKQIGNITARSAFYVTVPEGFESDNYFLNTVCRLTTMLEPSQILEVTESIERELGRTDKSENENYTDRLIDIDLLMYDDLILKTLRLTLPHPRMHERDFVLKPFASIAPDVIHPILNKNVATLQKELQLSD